MNNENEIPVSVPSPAAPAVVPPPGGAALPADATAADPAAKPKGPKFSELGLKPEVLRALEDMGFAEAMSVQAETLPFIAAGRDLMVQSRTGSGKTAAFGIPFANNIVDPEQKVVQALVLLPTRELALQVAAELARIAAHSKISVVPVYGGAPMGRQVELLRAGGQIVCGTPGRVLDHLRRGTLKLGDVKCAVLDECDEMLSMGFQEDIEAILEHSPESRQTLLFSATVPEGIQRLSRRFLRNPEFLKLSADFVGVHEIKHLYYSIPGVVREKELLRILAFEEPKSAIIFCNTREETGRVAEFLRQNGQDAEAISSDLSQSDRERVMARMRAGGIRFLVATDVAARGIDIENLSFVFNYTFPEAPEIYIHRTGRTGRAGKHGTAVSLIGPTEVGSFYYLKLLYKIRPEERALPSEAEIRSRREGERVLTLRASLADDPGSEWKALARRLMSAVDGERLVASLLSRSFSKEEGMPVPARPLPPAAVVPAWSSGTSGSPPAAREPTRDHSAPLDVASAPSRGFDRPARARGGFERPGRPERSERGERPDRSADRSVDRSVDRSGERSERPDRPERERSDRPDRFDRGARAERGERSGRPEQRRPDRGPRVESPPRAPGAPGAPPEREFWEVWSDERVKSATTPEAGPGPGVSADGLEDVSVRTPSRVPSDVPSDVSVGMSVPASAGPSSDGPEVPTARLYLNLGRKDGAAEREIMDLLSTHAGVTSVQAVDIMNTHTYLNVAPEEADRLCAALTGKEVAGRELVCERAKPRRR